MVAVRKGEETLGFSKWLSGDPIRVGEVCEKKRFGRERQ